MRPAVGCSNPAIKRRVVVLPQPLGPSRAKNSPSAICTLTWSTARTIVPPDSNSLTISLSSTSVVDM